MVQGGAHKADAPIVPQGLAGGAWVQGVAKMK